MRAVRLAIVASIVLLTPSRSDGQSSALGRAADAFERVAAARNAKKIALLTLGVAHQKHGAQLEQQQEIVMSISDIIMEVFAMESGLLRTRRLAATGRGANAADACAVYLRDAMARIELASRTVMSACARQLASSTPQPTPRSRVSSRICVSEGGLIESLTVRNPAGLAERRIIRVVERCS